jgi:hypothetical protein
MPPKTNIEPAYISLKRQGTLRSRELDRGTELSPKLKQQEFGLYGENVTSLNCPPSIEDVPQIALG